MITLESVGAAVFPAGDAAPVIYAHMSREEAASAAAALNAGGARAALVALECDWNRDLSPWRAPAVFRREPDFAGMADRHLAELETKIIPAVESALGYVPPFRAAAGYSLGGLFAVYALWRSALFSRAASMSGSLWFDGFTDFLRSAPPAALPEFVFLSLGDRESRTRSPRMAEVGRRTDETAEILRSLGVRVEFESNSGGHFDNVPERIARGLIRVIEA